VADILSAIGAVASGGVTGIVGAVAQRVFDWKNKKLDLEAESRRLSHELALRRVDVEIMEKEFAARTRVAEIEGETRRETADAEVFAASFREPAQYAAGHALSPRQVGWMVALDFLRGIVRPGLTLYLVILTTLIYGQAHALLSGSVFTPADALALAQRAIDTVLYLTTTATLWWFGTRNKSPAPKK
jgi:hypothetical protein